MSVLPAIIVPARLASKRFPRKLLQPVGGMPLILRTARRLRQQVPEFPLYFAVAEEELRVLLEGQGFTAILTDPELPSGTDRVAVANESIGATHVINVQADEPLVTRSHILKLAELIGQGRSALATLACRFRDPDDFLNPNRVKVVVRRDGLALYFSRSAVPYAREWKGRPTGAWLAEHPVWLHLGMYAYTADYLRQFRRLRPGLLEDVEKLEQLRALENGHTILVGESTEPTAGIDVPEDVEVLEGLLSAGC